VDFNAPTVVDAKSLTFVRTDDEMSLASCSGPQDVNADGLVDLVCHFDVQKAEFIQGNAQGFLKGKTTEGVPFLGTDSIRLLP